MVVSIFKIIFGFVNICTLNIMKNKLYTKKDLLSEFKCHRNTIYKALKGDLDSDLAKEIRERWKQMCSDNLKKM